MTSRIPEEAFDFYVALGRDRSYRTVAEKFGVSKRAITKLAARQNWPARLDRIEAEAREKADRKLAESVQEMNERHLKMLRAMAGRAIEGLKRFPVNSAAEAARLCEAAIKLERIIAGEPTDRSALSIEEVTRREIAHLLTAEPRGDDQDDW